MFKYLSIIALALALPVFFVSCDDDDPDIPNEEELITTVNYSLTPIGGGATVVLSFQDLDGDGGNAATITGGTLSANETYSASLELLNESEAPVEDITLEIEEEDLDHQFFFQSTIADLNISYSDMDSSGNPIGLETTLTTGAAGSGTITVTLKHEPMKNAAGVSDGDITNAEGETDIEVTFPVDVQ